MQKTKEKELKIIVVSANTPSSEALKNFKKKLYEIQQKSDKQKHA